MADDALPSPDALAPLHFDSATLPAERRFDAWRSALVNFDLSRRDTAPFAARADVWLLDPMVLTHATVDPLRYDRNDVLIRRDRHDHLALVYLIAGGFVGDYGRGRRASGPGSLTVLDMRHACWTDARRLEAFVLSLPRAFLMPRLGDLEPHGLIAAGGLAALFGPALHAVVGALPALHRAHAAAVARTIRDLVAETLLDAARTEEEQRSHDADLIGRVRAHIDEHLADPLDVATICQALGVSRSTLYRAFGDSGGVLQQVQRRRIGAVRARLADPAETRSIGELAAAFAFTDKSHLTRVFKREYGCTPGRYRTGGAITPPPADPEQVPDVFHRWTQLLD